MDEKYIFFLNDLNDFERSVFLYCKILKLPQEETAKHLHRDKNSVNKTCKFIDEQTQLLSLRFEILEAFIFNTK